MNRKDIFGATDEWSNTWQHMKYYFSHSRYDLAGQAFAQTLVAVSGGPIGEEIPHPHIPNLPPIVIPQKVDIAADLFAGLVYGITQEEQLTDLGECFYGLDEFVYDFLHAYNWIASKTFAGLMDGFILLLETVMYIPNDVMGCVHAKGDIGAFEQWLGQFKNPQELRPEIEYNLKHHLAQLTIHLNKARKEMAMQHFARAGEEAGIMLAMVT